MKTIYFIRHGQTQYNQEGKFIGFTDLPLSLKGREKIKTLWEANKPKVDMIFSSPLKRCVETKEIIFPEEKYIVIENMKEMDFGIFEGKTHMELQDNPHYINFRNSRAEYKIPNGESGIEFSKRILQAFNEMINIMDNEKKSTSALVCHGGVIMALFARFCKESDDIYYYQVDNGKGYIAEYSNNQLKVIKKL